MGFIGDIGHFIMVPLYYIISAVLIGWHELFSAIGLDPSGGLSWALSIIGLTLVIRAALIPLFVKQIKSSRNMQLLQPKVKELQKKYGHDRNKLAEETMKLYREAGTNPFASCLPILLQMPIFFALFRLLDQAARSGKAHGFLDAERARQFGQADIFGSIPIADSFWGARTWGDDPNGVVMVVALFLVLAMTATTFTTQRQLMAKNMPAEAMTGPLTPSSRRCCSTSSRWPSASVVSAFPIGVLLYWTTVEPVDDGPAVLRHPQQPRARDAGLQGQGGPRPREGAQARPRRAGGRDRRGGYDGDRRASAGRASAAEEAEPGAAQQERPQDQPVGPGQVGRRREDRIQ